MKITALVLTLITFCQLASAGLIAKNGVKFIYDEAADSWEAANERCSVEIISAKIVRKQNWDYIEYLVRYKNFGKKTIKKEKVSLLIAAKSETDKDVVFSGSLNVKVENRSPEDLLDLKTSIVSADKSETTFFAGYFGGRSYKYKHRCVFAE